jgi:L-glyceraldehyde 3-phosphate reductase
VLTYGPDARYVPAADRYETMPFRRVGDSGLKLPAISLGLWHNFGDDKPLETQRATLRKAFDLGVTHFDLANNYGPPAGAAEVNFGTILAQDLAPYRDELVISSKAGWDMWPGPYGFGGSRKYLVSSLDQTLRRTGLDYVDIFYHHRPDPETPLEETMRALDHIVRSGRALYVGVSSYNAELTLRAQEIMRGLGTPLLIHQPSYSMLNRWIEAPSESGTSLLGALTQAGMGSIVFTPLAQGMLTDRYLDGVPADSRAAAEKSLDPEWLTETTLGRIRGLREIAAGRGQSLAQMALAWVLREQADGQVTTALVGASSPEQIEDNVGAVRNLEFTAEELAEIDRLAFDSDINIWAGAQDSKHA